jgi:hypothetical protein
MATFDPADREKGKLCNRSCGLCQAWVESNRVKGYQVVTGLDEAHNHGLVGGVGRMLRAADRSCSTAFSCS